MSSATQSLLNKLIELQLILYTFSPEPIGNPLSANMNALTDGWLQGLTETESGDQVQPQAAIVTVSVAEAELESQSGSLGKA